MKSKKLIKQLIASTRQLSADLNDFSDLVVNQNEAVIDKLNSIPSRAEIKELVYKVLNKIDKYQDG